MRRAAGFSSEEKGGGPPLPNLPGHGQNLQTIAPRPKAATLKYIHGYAIVDDVADTQDPLNRAYKFGGRVQDVGPVAPFALHDGQELRQAPPQREPFLEPGTSGRPGRVPNWIAYDRKVLGFSGFFREEVPNSPLETWRVRKVAVRYYLENDQVEIVEMREANSGLSQGTLLRRHCAIKDGGSPLRWPDLRVGGDVALYRHTYHLLAADTATRAFFVEQGQEQAPNEPFPEGPFDHRRKALEAAQAARTAPRPPTRGAVSATAAPGGGPPLPHDPADEVYISPRGPSAMFELCPIKRGPEMEARDNAVLRFLASWDNTANTFGEVLSFSLFYYVADGTVEVREVLRRNSGRDPFPLLLSRCRLPKTVPPVFGRPMSPRSRRALALEYYDWRDLVLGATVKVYGRPLLLYNCDEGTRAWLQQNVPGIGEEQLKPIEVDFDPTGPKRPPLSIPPHSSGIGSEEDSLRNVMHLVPRAARRPYGDYLENWNKVLRFEAAMVPLGPGRPLVGPHDAERRLILSFHLLDRTMSVWEPKRDNSGMEHGTFLERTRVHNPATGQMYAETDMQVGSVLEVFGRGFQLLDADAHTLRYMEKESGRFPWSDYDKVLAKLASWVAQYPEELPDRLRAELLSADPHGSGYVSKYKLHALLSSLGSDLSAHEALTLVRHLGADRQGLLAEQLLVALGLAPPPEEPEEQQAPPEPLQPSAFSYVPYPAPALQEAAAAGQPPPMRAAWAPHPGGSLATNRAATATPAASSTSGYRGMGPAPGHPRVEPPPMPYQHVGGLSSWAGGDDRHHARDTTDKGWGGGAKTGAGFPPTGLQQPASLWQTTNNSYGGTGHVSSFRRR